MNALEGALRRVARDLAAAGHDWALVGGLAVSARAEPRTTRDVDVAVAVHDDDEAERLVLALQSNGYRTIAAIEQDAAHRLATVRMACPGDSERGVVVDLLFASSGLEPEITDAAEQLEIVPGLVVPVARLGHLMALKVLARDDRRRPQDLDDLRALLREATDEDLDDARRALALVAARGFHRGRALVSDFEAFLRDDSGEGHDPVR